MSIELLLKDAMKRAGIMDSVKAAMIVEASDRALISVFGDGVEVWAKTIYLENAELVIACTHASIGEEICRRGKEILDHLLRSVPAAHISRIRLLHKSSLVNDQAPL